MIELGKIHPLRIERFTPQGAYLQDEEENEILLPQKYLDEGAAIDDVVSVFVIKDSDNRRVAVRETPKLVLSEFAFLEIVEINSYGAFADWGLDKNLFIPYREQIGELEIGDFHPIQLRYDEATDRLYGSMRTRKSMIPCEENIEGQKVKFLLTEKHELGWAGIVNDQFAGMIFFNDCIKPLKSGMIVDAFVFLVRPDGKLDLRLTPIGPERYDQSAQTLLDYFKDNKFLFLTDKSDAEEIKRQLGMSKKLFKQAVGKLYKARKIKLFEDKIARVDE